MNKKIITLISCIILIILLMLFPKKNNNNNKITLAEVTHSVFYTPLYVAIENGYFKDEGLNIELILTSGADKVSAAVLSGDAHIGLAGAESAIYVYKQNQNDFLQIFSGLTKRDGQFIVSKNYIENFDLNDLYGQEILVGRNTGMPALNFLNALKKNNIDINKININYDIDFASLSGAFIGGTGNFVNLFEPNATKIEKENYGYIVSSVGLLSGEMPYTTFYAKKSFIENNKTIIDKFKKAINKALLYTNENDSLTLANIISNQFPTDSIEDISKNIDNYKQSDCWLTSSYISENLLLNLEDLLIDNNLLTEYIPYNQLIIN